MTTSVEGLLALLGEALDAIEDAGSNNKVVNSGQISEAVEALSACAAHPLQGEQAPEDEAIFQVIQSQKSWLSYLSG